MEARAWERRKRKAETVPVTRREVRKQLSLATGDLGRTGKDPVSRVTEDFHQTFDSIGQRRARSLMEGETAEQDRTQEAASSPVSANGLTTEGGAGQTGERSVRRTEGQTAAGPQTRPGAQRMPESGIPLEQFSETAFKRGKLSASVLGGTGKMMLVSCLKRSGGPSNPDIMQQESVFDTGSQTRNVPGHGPDKMLFNRGFVDSAVGLVVDTLRDARQTVDSMRDMALGKGEIRPDVEGTTLYKIYPFLDNSREKAMIEQYESRLRETTDADERAVLQNGLVHTRAVLDRKSSMKEEFINKLREISDKAVQALQEFEAPGFQEEVMRELNGQEPEPVPPGDGEAGETPPEGGDNPAEGGITPEDGDNPQGGDNPPEDDNPPEGGIPPENEIPPEGEIPPEDEIPPQDGIPPEDDIPPEVGTPPEGGNTSPEGEIPPETVETPPESEK